ncbi:MAG: winged helix-turn-helix transcriptional regulator [Anaerolineales bacterium]|jgi:DeoR family transcriptional regulator, suf operon transcriptional repressor
MTSTRERVLNTLLTRPRSTINHLAESVGINPISVRHHIARLEADGLVTSDEELHGVGRPRRVYFLTEDGVEHFPTRYMRLTLRLLEQLKETMPDQAVQQLFATMAEGLVEDYMGDGQTDGLSMEERLDLLQKTLTQEGFNVEWEKQGDAYHIREINCPYLHVSQNHPEVCSVDQTLISAFLDVPAEKVTCVLHGDAHCTYVVPEPLLSRREANPETAPVTKNLPNISIAQDAEEKNLENTA